MADPRTRKTAFHPFYCLLALCFIISFHLHQAQQTSPVAENSHPPHILITHTDDRLPAISLENIIRPKPKIAIIIDDIGYDLSMLNHFLSLTIPITYSVLPYSPYQQASLGRLIADGQEIMLHLPMEPLEFPQTNPGQGAMLIRMTNDELTQQFMLNLQGFPIVKGVNNHMGSRITASPRHILHILAICRQLDLYFIDSYTTTESVCRFSARAARVRFAKRDVFLDHVQTPAATIHQLQKLIQLAEEYGEAIGIGHPHRSTYDAIRYMLPELNRRSIIVPASNIVHIIG